MQHASTEFLPIVSTAHQNGQNLILQNYANRLNRLPDSVDFTSLRSFKRSLDTVDFSLLSQTFNSFALCFVFVCVHMYGQLLVPLTFLSYGTHLVSLFFMLFYVTTCSVK